jgi:hypothetical protein
LLMCWSMIRHAACRGGGAAGRRRAVAEEPVTEFGVGDGDSLSVGSEQAATSI